MKNFFHLFYVLALLAVPVIVDAQINTTWVDQSAGRIINVINNALVPLLLGIAFIVFLWGVFKRFIWEGGSGEAHTEGAKFISWGLIGFVVILSVWGLVNLLKAMLSLGSDTRPGLPLF